MPKFYSWSLFCFLLIMEGVQSRLQRNSSFVFRNHLFGITTIFEKNFRFFDIDPHFRKHVGLDNSSDSSLSIWTSFFISWSFIIWSIIGKHFSRRSLFVQKRPRRPQTMPLQHKFSRKKWEKVSKDSKYSYLRRGTTKTYTE